jgi:signal transduction histidine kinase
MATLSHELRTPLAAIKGYATALLLDEINWPDEKRHEFLQLIDAECDNLQQMIADILDSSMIDVGQLIIEPQPIRLPRLAREIAEEMQRRADGIISSSTSRRTSRSSTPIPCASSKSSATSR